jgi:uncharacterized protein (DUF58 family)
MFNAIRQRYRRAVDKWLFQLRDEEPGEVFLNQRRVFIVPTRPGLGLGVLLVALFIGSVNYSLSLGFGLTFVLAACAIVDMHLTFRNLAHLYLAAGRSQNVFAGEEAQFELHLINRRKHDRYAIWIGFIGPDLPDLAKPADVAANSSCAIVLGAPARRRGWMKAPRVRLQTRFPLGLLRSWSYWQPDARTLVYPRPEDIAPPLPAEEEGHGEGNDRAGQEDFAGVRPYQAGDSMKRLAWRQIARLGTTSGTLISKHFEGGAAGRLWLDYASLPPRMDVEDKLSRMTRWVLEAEARGLPYGFRLGTKSLPASLGPAHQEACLQALALYEGVR